MDRPPVTPPHRLRRVARTLRHSPDRLLHPLRRRHALRRLRQLDRHSPILFVCHGNICRSPYAAAAAQRVLPGPVEVASAGLVGPGRPSPQQAIEVAHQRGLSLVEHRSTLLRPDAVAAAALIVVMSTDQARKVRVLYGAPPERLLVLGDLDPEPIDTRTIRDPVEQPSAVFENVCDRIDRCLAVLARAVACSPHVRPGATV